MKIILIKDVKKQGKKGEILEVKDGYGNFLISNKSAVLATNFSKERLEKENEKKKAEENELILDCEKIKKKLESKKYSFNVKTGAQDKVFGSISSKQIADELKKLGFNIEKRQIKSTTNLDTLGCHEVLIELHKKVIAKIIVELKK